MSEGKFIVFENPGEIDLRAVTTMGVNVKDGDAIGQFGTGLKYAIAGVLRAGGEIQIFSGESQYGFSAAAEAIRGKLFHIVHMWQEGGAQSLGFTTELGKHWEPWMLYRELLSNALDEGGAVYLSDVWPVGEAEKTQIVVNCEELLVAHEKSSEFWIGQGREPLWADSSVEVYEGKNTGLFYRGIRAWNSPKEAPWAFTYNILEEQALTEDRSFGSIYEIKISIAKMLLSCQNAEVLAEAISQNQEYHLDYDWLGCEPSEEFVNYVLERIRAKKSIPPSARAMLERKREGELEKAEALQVPDSWEEMLEAEPKVVTEVKSSVYSYARECDARIEELETALKFWKKCAESLTERLRVPSEMELQQRTEALATFEHVHYDAEPG